jgi:hypothetical protein
VMMWLNVCDSAYRHNAKNAPADCDASIWSRSLRASGGHKSTLLRRSKADDSSAFHMARVELAPNGKDGQ